MKTNIVISLDTRKAKKDGSYPLVMRLGHNRKTTSIALGISLKEKDWDEKSRLVRKSYGGVENVVRLNNIIAKKRAEAMDIVMKLDEEKLLARMAITDLKKRIHRPVERRSFFAYAESLIADLKKVNRYGTARSYQGAVNVLKEFCGHKDLDFSDVDPQFLTRFEAKHFIKGNSANSLSAYFRAVRAIYNKAIQAGIVDNELYPFNTYKIKSTPTEKRAIDFELLKKIIALDLSPNDKLFHARNYFIVSYMMYGMSFVDLAHLKPSDIKDGRIQYQRKKTSKIYDIKVTKNIDGILSYYLSQPNDTGYIFPIIRSGTPDAQYKNVLWAIQRYNRKLKLIALKCGIEKNLTSYVSRHSFATQAMLQDVPLNAISTMLGHSSLKTTEIYLKALPSQTIDDYNAKIEGRLFIAASK